MNLFKEKHAKKACLNRTHQLMLDSKKFFYDQKNTFGIILRLLIMYKSVKNAQLATKYNKRAKL